MHIVVPAVQLQADRLRHCLYHCVQQSYERRSIYRDIEDINRIMLMLQEDIDLDEVDMMFAEAEESGDEEEVNELKTILYDKNKKGLAFV